MQTLHNIIFEIEATFEVDSLADAFLWVVEVHECDGENGHGGDSG